jgi:hypothetical protein
MFTSLMTTLSQGGIGIVVTGLALVFMGLGLIRMGSEWMVIAAVLTIPSTYTAGAWSGVLLLMRLLPLTQLFSAYAIEKEEKMLAWISAMPSILTLAYFFYDITVNQHAFRVLMG